MECGHAGNTKGLECQECRNLRLAQEREEEIRSIIGSSVPWHDDDITVLLSEIDALRGENVTLQVYKLSHDLYIEERDRLRDALEKIKRLCSNPANIALALFQIENVCINAQAGRRSIR